MPSELSIDDNTKPLSRPLGGSSGFQQQGQVDWVDLTKSTLRFSFGILSRLSAASVDSYTVIVGHLIGGSFELSRKGRRNMEGALAGLSSFGSLGNVIWFGFGVQNLVRSLSVTEQGATLVALCAALGESFSDIAAAEILYEIVKMRTDSTSTPSISQWRALIKCCSGTLSTTSFPIRAEYFMAMQVDGGLSPVLSRHNVNAEPIELAKVLIGIGKLSQGEWTSIEISGGREGGWLAAVAEWLFDLTVSITDEEGKQKFNSRHEDKDPQVSVFYTYTPSSHGPNGSQLRLLSRSYNLRSSEMLFETRRKTTTIASVSARVPWDNYLSLGFGKRFEALKEQNTAVGSLIGSAARMFEAIAYAESDVPRGILKRNELYMDASFGSGLLQTALHWLPELSIFFETMESASTARSYTDAKSIYEAHMFTVAPSCECIHCGPQDRKKSSHVCLVAMIETIIVLSRILAKVDVVPGLLPHRYGIKTILQHQTLVVHYEKDYPTISSAFDRVHSRTRFGISEHDAAIADVLRLFTGREYQEEKREFSYWVESPAAVSLGGICVYNDSLREPSDSRQLVGKLNVVPGMIEYNDRPCFSLECRSLGFRYEFHEINEKTWSAMANRALLDHVVLNVRESLHTLEVRFEIRDSAGHSIGMDFSPADLTANSWQARGKVSCDPSHHKTSDRIESLPQALKDQLAAAEIKCRMLRSPVLGRCAALMVPAARNRKKAGDEHHATIILRDKECMMCCVKAALRKDSSQILLISKPV